MQGGKAVGAGAGVERGNGRGMRRILPQARWHAAREGFFAAVQTALDQRRGFLLFPFAMIAGLLAYRMAGTEPDLVVAITLPAVATMWLVLMLVRRRQGVLAALALGLALGFALLPLHGALFGTPMLEGVAYGTYQARVDELLSATETGQQLVVSKITPVTGRAVDLRRARLFVRKGPVLASGDVISGAMRFAEVPGPAIPGGYDAQFHAYFDGIGAYGNATGTIEIVSHEETGLTGFVARLRQDIGIRIDRVLAGRADAVARALVIGDQSRIDDTTRNEMATAGIAHVLAISGLHLSLVAGSAFAALRLILAAFQRLSQRYAVKKLAAAAGIVVVLVYLAISGASVSATRASVMLILIFGAMLAGRRALTMRNVAFAALFVLVTEPAGLFRPGFQLSFAAVVALIGVYEQAGWHERTPSGWAGRVWRFFAGLSVTSLVAGLATAVFAAYHFQQTAPLGVAGNLVALPLLGFLVLPSLALGVLVMPLGLEAPLLTLAGWGIEQILSVATFVAAASRIFTYRPLLSPQVLLFALAAAAWFVFFIGRLRYAGPLVGAALIVFLGLAPLPDVLIADRTQAVGLRDDRVLMLMSGRKNSFVTDVWSETYGLNIEQGGNAIACDKIGCIGDLPGGARLAVETDIAAFIEDCDEVDLVVTRLAAPSWCRQVTQVIDADDLGRGGVTALYWETGANRFSIAPAITDSGRPWRIGR